VTHDEHRRRQEAILQAALGILTGDQRVLCVIATGSYARGEHDAFSDLDLGCYLRDEPRTGLHALRERVGAIAPLLAHMWLYDVNALYLFENGVRLDLDFYKPSELEKPTHLRATTRILHDPDGSLAGAPFLVDELGPGQRWFDPQSPIAVDWFFWIFRQIVCWAKRGGQGGPRAFDKLSAAAASLSELRAHLTDMILWTLDEPYYLSQADPEAAQRIARTYPRLEAEDVIDCTLRLLDEYERIAPACYRKAGLPCPAHRLEVLRERLDEFLALE
jgi:hypothetical protein